MLRPRFGKPLSFAATGLIFALCTGLFWYPLMTHARNASAHDIAWTRLMAGLLGGAVIMAGGVATVVWLLVRFRRLVIGKDRVQLVGPFGQVLGQIPYSNVDDIRMGRMHTDVEVRLYRRKRKDTWWPRFAPRGEPYDLLVAGGLELDATGMRLLMREALHRFREQQAARRNGRGSEGAVS